MPIEITLNAIRRDYILAKSRNSTFLIEERRTGKTTGQVWKWFVVGAVATYSCREFLNEECCCPELGEPLLIKWDGPGSDVIITSKLRECRRI